MKKTVVLHQYDSETKLTKQKKEFEELGFNVVILPPNVAMEVIEENTLFSVLNENGEE